MATTRIIPMHQNKGKTIRQCLSDRLDYGKNPDKTHDGQLISAYACDPETADAEFALSKREYYQLTGRRQDSDVIAYQVRQSFRPGEITPEEANRIGYEFAERFLKGNHAFIVCTHTDKQHIHNHIYWNSTSLDCTRKFRNFWGSTMAVRKLSDLICVQHRLSVIENPKPHGISYNRWQGDIEKLSNRDRLCLDMDAALAKKPHDLEGFYSLMEQAGYTVTRGKNITFRHPRQKRNIRMRSLPEEYREDAIREVLSGRRIHNPRKRRSPLAEQKAQLVSSLEAKQNQGRGHYYDLSIQNQITKQQARALLYYQQHGFTSADDFEAFAESVEAVKQRRDRIFMDEYYEHLRADNIEAFSKERNDEYVGRAEEYKAAKSALLEGLGLEHLFDHSHELTPKEKEIWMLFDRVDVAELLARDAFAKGAYMLGAEDREIMLK